MGIIADTMAEVVERTKNTMEGAATHLRTATNVLFGMYLQSQSRFLWTTGRFPDVA